MSILFRESGVATCVNEIMRAQQCNVVLILDTHQRTFYTPERNCHVPSF